MRTNSRGVHGATLARSLLEAIFRQQLNILGEHREEAAHQKHRHVFRIVLAAFLKRF